MTGDVVFTTGTPPPVDRGTTRVGVVTIGGTTGGAGILPETGVFGRNEGWTFGAATGVIWEFSPVPGLGQLGAWFAVTVIHMVTVVVCV